MTAGVSRSRCSLYIPALSHLPCPASPLPPGLQGGVRPVLTPLGLCHGVTPRLCAGALVPLSAHCLPCHLSHRPGRVNTEGLSPLCGGWDAGRRGWKEAGLLRIGQVIGGGGQLSPLHPLCLFFVQAVPLAGFGKAPFGTTAASQVCTAFLGCPQ